MPENIDNNQKERGRDLLIYRISCHYSTYQNVDETEGTLSYLQEVIQVIANTFFVMTNVIVVRSVTETSSSGLVDVNKIWGLHTRIQMTKIRQWSKREWFWIGMYGEAGNDLIPAIFVPNKRQIICNLERTIFIEHSKLTAAPWPSC